MAEKKVYLGFLNEITDFLTTEPNKLKLLHGGGRGSRGHHDLRKLFLEAATLS